MAVGPYALTSLANLQSYLGISAGIDETILEKSIDRATARIETYIGREIMARDRVVWLDCRGARRIKLPSYPVVTMNFVGYGARDAIAVDSDASQGDLDASVSIQPKAASLTDVTVRLARIPGSGTVPTTTALDGATYTRASTMAVAIDGTTGFDADVLEDHASRHLHRVGPLQLVRCGTVYLTVPDQNAITWRCDDKAGLLDIVGLQSYWPDDDMEAEVPAAWQSICVDYNAGYATVPDDIEACCLRVAAFMYRNRKRDETVSSESLGDYSYTLRDGGGLQNILDEDLAGWKEVR